MPRVREVHPVKFKNVLFVTDLSSSSEIALPHAIALAATCGSKVYIGHVITPQLYDLVPPDFVPEVLKQSTAYAQRRMERLIEEADFGVVPHECLLEQGELWQTLRRMADQHAVDVIALGAGGRGGLHEVVMGAIAEEILRFAHRPVLTVGHQSGDVPPEGKLRCILLANDFSANCIHAVACGDFLSRQFGARLLSLHVSEDLAEDPETVTRLEQYFCQRLEQSLAATEFQRTQLEFRVGFGSPADAILKTASERDVDLIVMGVRGAGTLAQPSCHLGKTTYRVVSESRCPVLSVPTYT